MEEDKEDGQWSKDKENWNEKFDICGCLFSPETAKRSWWVYTAAQSNKNSTEGAQRLLCLYRHSLPSIVAEAHFELGKLLQTFTTRGGSSDQASDTASRLYRVQQLHIYTKTSEQVRSIYMDNQNRCIQSLHQIIPTYLTFQDC